MITRTVIGRLLGPAARPGPGAPPRGLGEHKPGRIKPGRIKRAALSLQNRNYYTFCFLLGETSQHTATTDTYFWGRSSPRFVNLALGNNPV